MTEDKLLDFASKRAALLNLSSAWGTDEDGVLLIQLITRIEQLTAEVERLRELIKGPAAWLDSWATHVGNCQGGYACTCGLVLARSELCAALEGKQ